MKISVFGSGYVGLVTAACFADLGHHVIGVDIDQQKVAQLQKGACPIFEPGLPELLSKNLQYGRLEFTTNAAHAIEESEVIFIAVGTPQDMDGSADLRYVLQVAETIAEHLNGFKVIVDKSTVPVGTADLVRDKITEVLNSRGEEINFAVVSNPEFLKEGSAIQDCMRPDRIIIGTDSVDAEHVMRQLYAPFNRNHDRLMIMDVRSAELTKYASNAMLATKISFMNEMSRIAEMIGADIEQVRLGLGSDPRIGYHFIYAGCGYGGSCFPKDILALQRTAEAHHYHPKILAAVHDVNLDQKHVLFEKISKYFNNNLKGKTIAVWGLAFKPNTDDIREASSLVLLESLFAAGARVQAYDPAAMENIANYFGARPDLILVENEDKALHNSDALVIVTEWREFKSPNFQTMKALLNYPVIFDGRNLYDLAEMSALGFDYFGIGRGNKPL